MTDPAAKPTDEKPEAAAPSRGGAVTPMMAQYLAIKRDNPGCLLFYRMGDFYELFFDDAVEAAAALDIALTKRGRHLGDDIPMCGVPVHSHETYLQRLIRKGFKVAICEQVEDPAEARKRGAKAVVERAVIRTITAGTLTEDTLLDAKRNNFIAALAEVQGSFGLAWLDMSTGDFRLQTVGAPRDHASHGPRTGFALGSALARLGPGEVVIPDRIFGREDVADDLDPWRDVMTPLPASRFDSAGGERRLKALFDVRALDAFGAFSRAELAAGGALIDYVKLTQQGRLPRIARPGRLSEGAVLEIDAATRRNLELAQTMAGERAGSLLGVMDRTRTGAGGRLLAAQLAAPLTDLDRISGRLDRVQHFHDDHGLRAAIRERLSQCPDLERALSRISVGRGGPRDLAAIRDGLDLAGALREILEAGAMPASLSGPVSDLGAHGELVDHLRRALADDAPLSAKDGGFIAPGFSPGFDELKGLRDESRKMIAGLQDKYVRETGIANLKVKHNNVLGYFVEVTARNADAMPAAEDSPFIHRQTMANAVRYSTVELSDLEGRIASAAGKALALELELFAALAGRVMAGSEDIALAARAMAIIDVASSLADLAADRRYRRPQVDGSRDFEITGGRHPVVEQALARSGGAAFVANDCALSGADRAPNRIWLLTGPNMAGKSTFLRQNALIAVMAQMGSFVPAEAARIGVVDRLFSRVGAGDDLARGRSTFMVEMVETAAILAQSTDRSLVILDEIGRGTATFDGLSIAWAVVEHLHEVNNCRTLFATHYHELTNLSARLDALTCHTMRVKEWKGDVVFLHEVTAGAADRSYGIHVGRLAGLPDAVVGRAEEVLKALEEEKQTGAVTRLADDLPLFSAVVAGHKPDEPSELEQALAAAAPDELSPKDALELVYRLKELLKG